MNTKEFKGGIQKGTVATDARARKLDEQCKNQKESVFATLKQKYPDLTVQRKLTQEQIPGGIGACEPDGGAWYYRGVLIVVSEAKKQQDRGNAIERWFKNNYICRLINPNVSYITFCTGEGAYRTWDKVLGRLTYGQIVKALNVAHLDGFDQYHPGQNSAFLSPDGFTEEFIHDRTVEAIEERINHLRGV
ncbi:restriction endonuclease [Synechococcus phage S-CREM2]|nr:restriction endonuclease [Synechococcus phage S-CREM2]